MRIGIDLGGSKTEGIILGDDGLVVSRIREATPQGSYEETVELVRSISLRLQQEAKESLTVGIGTPGALSPESGLMKNCNSICLNGRPLKADIEAALGYEVMMENDANCFVLSEALLGAAKEFETVFGVIIGTGTGGGICIDGQLLSGRNRIAGEWGHNTIPQSARHLIGSDRPCYCGRLNCVETLLSGPGLSQTHLEATGKNCSAEVIARQAGAGNADAISSLETYVESLATCLASVINVLDPDAIVLGGGLSNIDYLYESLPEKLVPHVFSDSFSTRLLKPAFGDASGARGAACLWPSKQ